jgi:hypothetical protein
MRIMNGFVCLYIDVVFACKVYIYISIMIRGCSVENNAMNTAKMEGLQRDHSQIV